MASQTSVELQVLAPRDTSPLSPLPQLDTPTEESPQPDPAARTLPKGRSIIIITQLGAVNFVTSFTNGLLTVGIPAIAADLALAEDLLLWPQSVYFLTSGSCLLLAGTIADVIGPRSVNLVGSFFLSIFILASGLARTGIELIMFRAMQGIAGALVIPSSVSIISKSLESGRPRNIGFACIGLSAPLGFSFGMVLGGVFVSAVGWRVGYYMAAPISFISFLVGIFALPAEAEPSSMASTLSRLKNEVDWIGAAVASTSLAMFSYVLAMLSSDTQNVRKPANIALLSLSLALAPAFAMWMRRQQRLQKPALIPNALWKNGVFSSVCFMVLTTTAVINCMETFSSLFFQEVQGTTALGASLRLLPSLLVGALVNLMTGVLVDKVPVLQAVLVSSILAAGAPLLMAVINPTWPYWYDAFFAQALGPLSVDILFTVGILVISDQFPDRTQALAGAVFNTVAQLGASIGLTVMQVISITVTKDSRFKDKNAPVAIEVGYKASFWAMFAWMAISCVVGGFGLRKLGKIGQKRD